MKKFIISICVICMIFSQGVVAFAVTQYVDTEQESNNCMEDANDILINETHEDIWIFGIVNENDKEDWFKFTCDWNGQSNIYLRVRDENINCNLYLYDSKGRCIASSKEDAGRDEEIDYIYIHEGKDYYVKVEYESGTVWTQPYELEMSVWK